MTSEIAPVNTRPGKARIALVAFTSLGDGLVYLMMAENLRRNGYNVTYYGNIAYQLRAWLPQLTIRPHPEPNKLDDELAPYDLAILSPSLPLRNSLDEQGIIELRNKWLLICLKTPPSWRHDQSERVQKTCPPEVFEELRNLLDCGGSIRFRKFTHESVVEITLEYMRQRMHLAQVDKHVPLTPPAGLQHRRHPKRIIVSPDSAGPEKKNWTPRSFFALCHQLQSLGYDPKIIVAPVNHEHWKHMPGNVFETPVFHDIAELSAYLYESGALIANDSGNGHLASFLGIPVVTIFRKRNPHFHWRPGWAPGVVVCPKITLPGLKGAIWKPFVGTRDVIAALRSLL